MSNYKAITGSSKIVHRNQGGGSKLQGIPSSTNLNTWAHVAFRNRNVVCPCNRNLIFCMNQLGGVGAGGIPGRSYAFAPSADGTHKQFYCDHRFVNGRWLIYPKKDKNGFTTIAKYPHDNVKIYIVLPYNIVGTYKTIKLNKDSIYKVTSDSFSSPIIFKVISKFFGLDKLPYYNVKLLSEYPYKGSDIYSNLINYKGPGSILKSFELSVKE
jgi:hypothetical protein